jgi:hypothetical protein
MTGKMWKVNFQFAKFVALQGKCLIHIPSKYPWLILFSEIVICFFFEDVVKDVPSFFYD